MFATVEEAEKAAAMLRRFGDKESWIVPSEYGPVLGIGHGEAITSWEHLADFLLARQDAPREDHADRADKRARLLAKARDWLRVARVMDPGLPQERTQALINAVDRLLEALA
jgi:hypothetical protein